MNGSVGAFRELASFTADVDSNIPDDAIRQAILIREVEEVFLELFAQGRMNGTVHTCVGQEFSAVAVAGQLSAEDWVTSNHRCHGHFIAKTGNWKGLIDELMGLKTGVCMGIGSSQHLYAKGFLSNGPQAALVPVATGIGLYNKRNLRAGISVSFIGEGTLGEGVLYEALNLAALLDVPQLFVCENNLYSQSTPQADGVAGTIRGRAEAFGLRYFEGDTWNTRDLIRAAGQAIEFVRREGLPAFLTVRTYRLNAHSKGDDDRDVEEVAYFRERDPLNRLLAKSETWRTIQDQIRAEIRAHVAGTPKTALTAADYVFDQLPRERDASRLDLRNENIRMIQALNRAYHKLIAHGGYMIGEDVLDPYGGAFKVTKGLSSAFPLRVIGTPISEAGIVGIGIGLALMGAPSYVEIMFGDFVTNVFDQLISNASKFFHMYAFQVAVPLRVRTPMGGKRGYGPTHSQSLEKHLVGMDNVAVIALSSLEDPGSALLEIHKIPVPVVIIESKVDYGRFLWQGNPDYQAVKQGGALGAVIISPTRRAATVTVVAYGDTAREIADQLKEIFLEADFVIELIVLTSLHPLDPHPIQESARKTKFVVVVEDGSVSFGIGSEVVAQLCESEPGLRYARIGSEPVPVPSIIALEKEILPSARKLMAMLASMRIPADVAL